MTGPHIGRRELIAGAVAFGLGTWAAPAEGVGSRRMPIRGTYAASRRVGGLEVVALLDASGSFGTSWEQVFSGADASDWERARTADPEAFGADGTWHLDFHCFAIRRPDDKVILVDVGVGPEGSPASSWAPVPGRLPDALPESGINPDDVVMVVMTHLHEDHLGWAVLPDGAPLFPNATYIVQRREIRHLDQQSDRTIWDYAVAPLLRTGQLEQVDGRARLPLGRQPRGAKATVIPTPGHTVGHQSVIVADSYDEIVITGDVLVHAVQLVNPDVAYEFEQDPDRARQTRERLLARASRNRAELATAHLTQPFVRA